MNTAEIKLTIADAIALGQNMPGRAKTFNLYKSCPPDIGHIVRKLDTALSFWKEGAAIRLGLVNTSETEYAKARGGVATNGRTAIKFILGGGDRVASFLSASVECGAPPSIFVEDYCASESEDQLCDTDDSREPSTRGSVAPSTE